MHFFDLDGTIIDSNALWVKVDEEFLGRRGLKYSPEYQEYITHCIFDTAASYTREYYGLMETEAEIKAEWLEMAREHYTRVALKPGAGEFLLKCRNEGRRMAIITSCMKELLELALDMHGLSDYFEFVVYANDLGVEKRHPDAFLHGAAVAGADPKECVMFEDSPQAAAGAKAAGMMVVGVYDSHFARERRVLEDICDTYIESFYDLL